ncbi:glycoside hydrolase [Trichodelitschia bisporula]|uniref:Glycoside hydrolase n=1 Tax=Trichodelitschia bisporula TaxID=703511 RepID=A0A6G1HIN6_9PEZI|nr:glycoside hydrolase [Trichodelitschia bisporula]
MSPLTALLWLVPFLTLSAAASYPAVVNLRNLTGPPQHLAAGILYGLPDPPRTIPEALLKPLHLTAFRSGGAQIPAPGRGWSVSEAEYLPRFASALHDYQIACSLKASFILLPHDLWGSDGTQDQKATYPGDGGWGAYDKFLARVVRDIKEAKMQAGLSVDIWNEADLSAFWTRSRERWEEVWVRAYKVLRRDLPGVKITGPAFAGPPSVMNPWWTGFMALVKRTGTVPDEWVWHLEGGESSMDASHAGLAGLLKMYGLPERPINVDEYGTQVEQTPAGSAWWIGQLERHDARGLRGNWAMGRGLRDGAAGLLSAKRDGGYVVGGEWRVYAYYANMTGVRVGTRAGGDGIVDAYATVDGGRVKVLVGVRKAGMGMGSVRVEGVGSVTGLVENEIIGVRRLIFGVEGQPVDLGVVKLSVVGDAVVLEVGKMERNEALAFEMGGI